VAPRAGLTFLRQFPPSHRPKEIVMFRKHLATTALTAALTLVPAAAMVTAGPASAAPTHTSGVYGICIGSTPILKTPGKGFIGTLSMGQTMKVKRVSKSGLYAYGFARGSANKNGWIKVSAVCPKSGGLGDSRIQGTI
jgi:hypothetical protein